MSYLWTVENLSGLAWSPEPRVRAWACERLKTVYGKAGVNALEGLLKERDEDVLREALDYLIEYPSPQFADHVLDIYKREKGFIASRAAMVLAKLKDDRVVQAFFDKEVEPDREGLQEFLEVCKALGELKTEAAFEALKTILNQAGEKPDPVNLKSILDSILNTGKGLDFVLDYYLKRYKDLGTPIISALLDHCLFWHDDEELSEGKKGFFRKGLPPVVDNALSILKANAEGKIGKELERLFKKEDFPGVIRSAGEYADNLVREAAEHVGEKPFAEWKERDSQPRINHDLITALKNLPSCPKDAMKGLAIAAAASLAGLEEMKFLIGLSRETGIKTLLYSFLEDRGDTVDDKWIEDILLNSPERDKVAAEIIRIIDIRKCSFGIKRRVRLLGLIGDESAIPCLVEIIGKKSGDMDDEAIDEAQSALTRFGERALPQLEVLLDHPDHSVINELFFVLKDIPVKRAEELLLKNWDRFMGISRELFTMALEGVASKEFIPLLRKEIKEDELIEAEVFHLLCLIHGVKDPLLPEIGERLKKSDAEIKSMMGKIMDNDLQSLMEQPLNLELGCLKCGRAYLYKISEVVIDPEKPGAKPQITDTITCKNCGSVNNYRLTDKGSASLMIRASMMAGMLKEGKIEDPLALPIKLMKMRFMGNRPMSSIKEAIEEYKRELEKAPHDPALRIGYGNMLKRQGMLDEAELQFREAARLEPNAVEAYTQLGEIAEKRGDIHAAYDFYAKALRGMPDARYFKIPDIEIFKEIVVEKHHYLRGKAKAGKGTNIVEDLIKVEPQRRKAGRNDPCPCGSGKKYKKCCLEKDEAASHKTATTPVEKSLTDRLISFSFKERFKKDFESAYLLYFNRPFREPVVIDEEKGMEFGAFLEWFIHDYLLKSGKTVVEEFYQDEFRRLSGDEREVLEAEMLSSLSVYEVTAVTPDEGVSLRDLFTGEEFEVKDVKGSQLLVKWDIAITRAIRQKKVNKLSGLVTLLPREDKERFTAILSAKWEEFRRETGKNEWKAFMKTRGHLLSQVYNERGASRPVPFTEEHHPVVDARAEYDVLNFQAIRRLLSNEFDFVLDDEKEGMELRYTWLKRGKSEKWEEAVIPKVEGIRPIVVQSQFISPGGDVRFTTLGTIRITSKSLTFECISKERLGRGKARLKEVLGDCIVYRSDSIKDFDPSRSKKEKRSEKIGTGIDNETKISLMSRYYSQYVEEWIKNPIPILGGISPLESCKTEAGRIKLDELLKDMENSEERKRRDGEPYMDVNKIRERLNILECGK